MSFSKVKHGYGNIVHLFSHDCTLLQLDDFNIESVEWSVGCWFHQMRFSK